jgi:sister chromatid cohesion protein DCC1
VLCTEDKTYALRTVVLSNSMLVTGPSARDEGGVVIRTELHDVLELTPCLPRLNRLQELLLGFELGEDTLDEEQMSGEEDEEYGSYTGDLMSKSKVTSLSSHATFKLTRTDNSTSDV